MNLNIITNKCAADPERGFLAWELTRLKSPNDSNLLSKYPYNFLIRLLFVEPLMFSEIILLLFFSRLVFDFCWRDDFCTNLIRSKTKPQSVDGAIAQDQLKNCIIENKICPLRSLTKWPTINVKTCPKRLKFNDKLITYLQRQKF